jgi:hypothetical protein
LWGAVSCYVYEAWSGSNYWHARVHEELTGASTTTTTARQGAATRRLAPAVGLVRLRALVAGACRVVAGHAGTTPPRAEVLPRQKEWKAAGGHWHVGTHRSPGSCSYLTAGNTFSPCPRGLPATRDRLHRRRASQQGRPGEAGQGRQASDSFARRRCVRWSCQISVQELGSDWLAGRHESILPALAPPDVKNFWAFFYICDRGSVTES